MGRFDHLGGFLGDSIFLSFHLFILFTEHVYVIHINSFWILALFLLRYFITVCLLYGGYFSGVVNLPFLRSLC